MNALLSIAEVSKAYAGVQALTRMTLDLGRGEIRGLVGENGAGKSTLIKILAGAVRPDAGTIRFAGEPLDTAEPASALKAGIAVIYQEFAQAPHLTVAENICLGALPRTRFGLVDWPRLQRRARDVLDRLGFALDVGAKVAQLGVAQRQVVEIARAVAREARLIVLDEPSAVLGDTEIHQLFQLMRRLRAERGVSFVYVSHRLDEVFEICDSVTVLRDGRHVETGPVAAFTRARLIQQMVGRDLTNLYPDRGAGRPGALALTVDGLSRAGALHEISLEVRRGEIVGLCGLSGAGRSEVLLAIAGAAPGEAGTITVNGQAARIRAPADAIARGIGLIPEDRKMQGLCLGHGVRFNMSLSALQLLSRAGVVDAAGERGEVDRHVRALRIKTPGLEAKVGTLSGGNQQKCLLGRQLAARNDILLVDEPTRGVDVGARREIYELLVRLARERSIAILMVSSDMPEVIGLCDRIYVMREGRITAELAGAEATEHAIMSHAAQ